MNRHKNTVLYQGRKKRKDYFEGWYFKQVDEKTDHSISFIPSISIDKDESLAFIQCIYSNEEKILTTYNFKYPFSSFKFSDNPFSVTIGNSYFSKEKIVIDIDEEDLIIKGEIRFTNLTPIETSFISPNIMGFFSYIPKMECNHSIVSMRHDLNGSLLINGNKTNYSNGIGYIEKDYGSSFPIQYIWIQSNHFKEKDTSFFCSVANIPFMGHSFKGFICNLVLGNKEYRFATYNHSKIKVIKTESDKVYLKIKKGKMQIEITSKILSSSDLFAPKNGVMKNIIKEGLSGTTEVTLSDNKNNIIYSSVGIASGIEIVE